MHNHGPIYLVFYNFFVRYPCPGNSWPPAQALDCRTFVFWSCSHCLCICSSCPKNSTRRLCSRVHCIFLTSPCHPGTSCHPAPCLRIVGTSSWCHARTRCYSCPRSPTDSTLMRQNNNLQLFGWLDFNFQIFVTCITLHFAPPI